MNKKKYYLAPLEGITTYVYRRAYHTYYKSMDKYFTPFFVPHTKKGFNTRETQEILPDNNEGMYLVPQILTNDVEGFLQTVEKLKVYGYREVNLNLGCPSKTVVSKFRGSGFLAKPKELDEFLYQIFEKVDVKVSVKTRIGRDNPEEFDRILDIYNRYPLEELIIHPRVQKDYYGNTPNLNVFSDATKKCRCPLCYNGDIFMAEDCQNICGQFPKIGAVMLGRGIIGDPELLEDISGCKADMGRTSSVRADGRMIFRDVQRLRAFHDKLLAEYREINFGDTNVLFKMKEIWCYLGKRFEGGEKILKKIKKAQKVNDYEKAVDELFALLS